MIATMILALLAVVNVSNSFVTYACDGVNPVFQVNYPYLASSDLVVTSTTAGGVVTTLTQGTDWTVNISKASSTGTLTLNSPASKCPAGNSLKIARAVAYTQPQPFRGQTTFNPSIHEDAYDRLAMEIEQLATLLPPAAVALGLQNKGSALGNISTLNCIGYSAACSAVGGVGALTVRATPTASDPTPLVDGDFFVSGTGVGQMFRVRLNGATAAIGGNPMFSAYSVSAQSIQTGNTTIVIYNSVEVDSDSAYNAVTGRYTIPAGKGGDYLIKGQVAYAVPITGTVQSMIHKNGGVVEVGLVVNTGTNQTILASTVLRLAAGDVIDIRTNQTSGGFVSLSSAANTINRVLIKRLSD